MSETSTPWLLPAYRHRNRTYAALTHWDASDLMPPGAVNEARSGFINDKGQFLDRVRAYDYADKHDLLRIRGEPGQRNELWSEARLNVPRAAYDYLDRQDVANSLVPSPTRGLLYAAALRRAPR